MRLITQVLLIGLVGLTVVSITFSSAGALTITELREMCANYPDGKSRNTCQLYIRSLIEFANSDDRTVNPKGKLCIGSEVAMDEVIIVLKDWLSAHPELRGSNAFEAAYPALASRYRCK